MFTDDLWAAMEPNVLRAKRHKGGQPPALPERMFFEALLYLARTAIPWRDLPAEFGRWTPSTTPSAAGSTPAACDACSRP